MNNHSGNSVPEITREEHDGDNFSKRVTVVSTATLFAVVNTAAAGQSSVVVDGPVAIKGNVTIDSGLINIIGNMTLSDSKGYIGLTTTTNAASPAFIGIVTIANTNIRAIAGNVTLDDGSLTGIIGNVTLSDAKTFIGLTTTTLGASPAFIGLTTSVNASSTAFIGLTTSVNATSTAFIGIVTIANTNVRSITGNVTLSNPNTYIGLVTATNGAGDRFIGLVTAVSRNAGTNKTLIPKNLNFAQGSIATIAVPTNTFYITKLLLNSNATVRLNIKSGATYLTGNVSLGINLVPGGGWVEIGAPDAPIYNGLAAQAAIVLEKFDSSGVVSQIGGHLMYFDE